MHVYYLRCVSTDLNWQCTDYTFDMYHYVLQPTYFCNHNQVNCYRYNLMFYSREPFLHERPIEFN